MTGTASRFEHFEILKDENGELMKLGLGGMGTTYRAYDLHLRKLVALKIINERTVAEPTARRRFFNEARAAASIDHPNVARVIFLCPEDAVQCSFAMELVEGETLARRIVQQGVMSAADALRTLRPIADALVALGTRALVHRDIKPENIMTTRGEDGRFEVKLIDFGRAKTTGAQSGLLESVGTGERFVGSAYFASPEQINPTAAGIDGRSDFYSLGATLWHCVTGAPPFTGTFFEVQEAHIYKDPPWEKIAAQPPALAVLLHQLLAKDPSARPPNARSLVAAWDQALATLASAPPREGPSESVLETSTLASVASPFRIDSPPVYALPAGAMPPPPSGALFAEADGGGARFVRRIPPTLAPELLAALKRAAQTARDVDHPGLLAIREIDPTSIAVAWPVSVTAAQVAVWYRSALPAEIVLAWLPRIAATIDAAHTRGLMHLGVQPDRILVEYDPANAPQSAPSDLDFWRAAKIWIDPLAAFDPALVATARNIDSGGLNKRAPACSTVREYIAALARCIRDLMGGKTDGRPQPIAAFDETRNHLVVEAISYRVNARSCSEWAQHLVGGVPPARVIPAALPVREPAAPAAQTTRPPPAKTPAAAPAPTAASPARARWPAMKRPAGFVALGALFFAVLGGSLWKLTPLRNERQTDQRATAALRALMEDGDAALARMDFLRADSVVSAVEHIDPANPWLATFRARVASIRATPPQPAPTPTPPSKTVAAATPLPPTPPGSVTDPSESTRMRPFINSCGVPFIPIRIIGGPSHGRIVLFSSYETRVRDFEPLADPKQWQRDENQRPDDPAVNVLPADAVRFAAALTKREKLPPGWFYRLPTDHEWSCAAGIGELESPVQSASGKSDNFPEVHPWGRVWPPPPKNGNFADTSLLNPALTWIADYTDGFPGTAPAGSFAPHPSGLFDLAGNAAEWCLDENANALRYVLRGGSWNTFDKLELLSSHRTQPPEDARRAPDRGFRLVLTAVRIAPPRGSGVRPAGGSPGRSSNTILRPTGQ